MEERRLKNLISHLSLRSSYLSENSAVLSVVNKAVNKAESRESMEKGSVAIPDITQGNPVGFFEEQKAFRFPSKATILASRQSRLDEQSFMRGARSDPATPSRQGADAQLREASQCKQSCSSSAFSKGITRDASLKERPSHSFTPYFEAAKCKCECQIRSRTLSAEVQGDTPCLQMNDQGVCLRRSAEVDTSDNTGQSVSQSNQMQKNSATQFKYVCSSCDAKIFELEAQCKSLNSGKVLVDSLQGGDAHRTLCVVDAREAFRAQTPRSLLEPNLMACRDVLDSQPGKVGMDISGSTTLRRNNVMIGQMRHMVDDCIFCLIIQGQSPAFKLYEDEMCICILDVHPLTHGHSLLIPKAHFPSLELTPPEVAAAMCATVPFISMAIMQATNCDSFNLLVNSGKAAGQVVLHTHFHIIPRRSGDNLWRSEDDSRRTLPVGNETALLVQQIRHNLSNKFL